MGDRVEYLIRARRGKVIYGLPATVSAITAKRVVLKLDARAECAAVKPHQLRPLIGASHV